MAGYFCPECRKVLAVHEWKAHQRRHVNPTIRWPRHEAQLPLWREKVPK